MSNEKFTQGEWEVKSLNTHWETTGMTIYSTQVIAPSAGYIISSIDTKDEKLLKMIQANAHLIAAAPDMYRLLEQLHGTLESVPILQSEIESVLKKARGGKNE
jgi:cytochrome b561